MTVELTWSLEGSVGAPVLVLLNSLGATTSSWDALAGPLAEEFQIARVDHRGHGHSAAAPGQPIATSATLDDLGADTLTAIDAICAATGARSVSVAGISLGGMLAIWLAARHPDRISRIALLCTSASLDARQAWLDRARTVRTDGMPAISATITQRWITPELAHSDPLLLARLRSDFEGCDPESYAQCCEAIADMDQTADLARIAARTIIIAGAQDAAIAPRHSEILATAISGAQLHVVAPAAHLAIVESCGAITDLLLGHFRAGATLQQGFHTRRAVLGDAHVDRSIAATTQYTQDFQHFITRYAWGDIWSRPELARRDRSLLTIACLVTLGAEHEFAMHVRAALTNGLTRADIAEAVLHAALYAGLPRANRALALAQQVFDEST